MSKHKINPALVLSDRVAWLVVIGNALSYNSRVDRTLWKWVA